MNAANPTAHRSLCHPKGARCRNLTTKMFGQIAEYVGHVKPPNRGMPLLYL